MQIAGPKRDPKNKNVMHSLNLELKAMLSLKQELKAMHSLNQELKAMLLLNLDRNGQGIRTI